MLLYQIANNAHYMLQCLLPTNTFLLVRHGTGISGLAWGAPSLPPPAPFQAHPNSYDDSPAVIKIKWTSSVAVQLLGF